MKREIIGVVVFLFAVSLVCAEIPSDCSSDMVAYYRFEDNAKDSLNKELDGVWSGTAVYGDPSVSQVGNSSSFDGSSYINVSEKSGSALDLINGFTIQFWMGKSDLSSGDGDLVDKGEYEIAFVQKAGPNGVVKATVKGISITSAEFPFATGKYFITVAWRPHSGSNLSIYVNGALSNSTVTGGNIPASTDHKLTIGKGFVGIIDELSIYNTWHNDTRVHLDYLKTLGGKNYCDLSSIGGVSSTQTDFNIWGCDIPGENLGIVVGACSSHRDYFCNAVNDAWNTMDKKFACTEGSTELLTIGDAFTPCCPSGTFCDAYDDGGDAPTFKCIQQTYSCASINTNPEWTDALKKTNCLNNHCFWMIKDSKGVCVQSPYDFGCTYYGNEEDCSEDIWNLGREGVGTDICGTYVIDKGMTVGYVIPQDSCRCSWDSGKCKLAYDVHPHIYSGTANNFTCMKDFTTGECVGGKQKINWSATLDKKQGIFTDSPLGLQAQAILNASNCKTGFAERSCGDDGVKLPFFSVFSVIATIVLIGLFYRNRQFK